MKGVVLAKTEGGNHMWDTANRLGGEVRVIALIETARGYPVPMTSPRRDRAFE